MILDLIPKLSLKNQQKSAILIANNLFSSLDDYYDAATASRSRERSMLQWPTNRNAVSPWMQLNQPNRPSSSAKSSSPRQSRRHSSLRQRSSTTCSCRRPRRRCSTIVLSPLVGKRLFPKRESCPIFCVHFPSLAN